MKLSIIIPVYNAEEFIDRCLLSIGNTDPLVEIIVVNDGSRDGSLTLLEQWALKDRRIKVVDQPNSGVSIARNHGLSVATGDYVTFLDADDYYLTPIYPMVAMMIQRQPLAELIIFGYQRMNHLEVIDNKTFPRDDVMDQSTLNQHFTDYYGHGLLSAVWNKVYQRQMLIDHGCRFDSNYRIGEDLLFNLQVFRKCQMIQVCEAVLYAYELGNLHQVTKNRGKDEWLNQLSLLEQVEAYRMEFDCPLRPTYQKMMDNVVVSSLVLSVSRNEGLAGVNRIINHQRFQNLCGWLRGYRSHSSLMRWMIAQRWTWGVYGVLSLRQWLKKAAD